MASAAAASTAKAVSFSSFSPRVGFLASIEEEDSFSTANCSAAARWKMEDESSVDEYGYIRKLVRCRLSVRRIFNF